MREDHECDVTKKRRGGIETTFDLKRINIHLPNTNFELKFYKRTEIRNANDALIYDIVLIPKNDKYGMKGLDRLLSQDSASACCPMINTPLENDQPNVTYRFNFLCPNN